MLNCDSDSSSDDGDDPSDCDVVTLAAAEALADFNDANELNFNQRCIAYKAALENVKQECGDETGNIQLLIDNLGDCTQSSNGPIQALMTANIDGEQFNVMKPNGFNFFNKAIGIVTYSYFSDEDYIRIQGNSTYQTINPSEFTKEITIWIPQSSWSVGTYNLADDVVDFFDSGVTPTPHYNIVYFNNDDYPQAFENEGTITITEFNLADRIIRGTFEFTFMRSGNNGDIGPFDCMNGTFDYSLDDDYFD